MARPVRPTTCGHPDRANHSNGLCGTCYMRTRPRGTGRPTGRPRVLEDHALTGAEKAARWRAGHREEYLAQQRQRQDRTPEKAAWRSARGRTTNPSHPAWRWYGARGIRMADEWLHDFAAFLAYIGPKPAPSLSLDRIDNDGNYAPGNVRWTDAKTQRANQRDRERN